MKKSGSDWENLKINWKVIDELENQDNQEEEEMNNTTEDHFIDIKPMSKLLESLQTEDKSLYNVIMDDTTEECFIDTQSMCNLSAPLQIKEKPLCKGSTIVKFRH